MDNITERFLMQNGYSFRKSVHQLDQREIPCRWSYEKLGNELIKIGDVVASDPDYKIHVVRIMAGKMNMNPATVICQLEKNEIRMTSFAAEGLIKQNTNEEAMKKIEDLTHGRVSTRVAEYTEEGVNYSRSLNWKDILREVLYFFGGRP